MMIAPIDFSRVQTMLTWPAGWAEILLTAFAIGLAWAVDRRLRMARRARSGAQPRESAGVGFPLLALLLLYLGSWIYRRAFGQEPFLLSVVIALMAALAAIRALVYGLRRVFSRHEWLVPWERTLGAVVWVLLALYYFGVLDDIIATLDSIEVPIGKTHPTLLSIVSGVLVLLLSLIVTLWISGTVERRLDRATGLDSNLRAVLSRLIRAALLVAGGLIALEAVGFDLTVLTVFGGAVGVGIGLGLQRLAANYISGFTILLDRSVRLGDSITVDNRRGTVTQVTSRYVLLQMADGVHVIVPNETLVTTTVLNHSHVPSTSPEVRVAIQVPVSPDADIDRAIALLERAALVDPRVLRKPPHSPLARIASFGDTGVNIELGAYVADASVDVLALRGVIQREVLRTLKANGIGLAYPRRDVYVTGMDKDARDEGDTNRRQDTGPV
jgi:small-conductance mechanosensitive channel